VANVARGSASMARDALAQMPESQRTAALGTIVPFVAMHDLNSARAMLAEFERRIKEETEVASTREAKDAVKWTFTRAAREMIRTIGPRDASLAARYQPREEALAMLATQAAPLDRETANEFLDRAWKNIQSSAERAGERYGVNNYVVAPAPLDPARARMILKANGHRKKRASPKQPPKRKMMRPRPGRRAAKPTRGSCHNWQPRWRCSMLSVRWKCRAISACRL
jgi:hypothetical protein